MSSLYDSITIDKSKSLGFGLDNKLNFNKVENVIFKSFSIRGVVDNNERMLATISNGIDYVLPTSSTSMSIASDSSSDTSKNVGVYYYTSSTDTDLTYESISLNASDSKTEVSLSNNVLRIEHLRFESPSFNGNIYLGYGTFTNGIPTNICATIDNNVGFSQLPFFWIPSGYKAYNIGWVVNHDAQLYNLNNNLVSGDITSNNDSMTLKLYRQPSYLTTSLIYEIYRHHLIGNQNNLSVESLSQQSIPSGSTTYIKCVRNSGSNDLNVSILLHYIFVQESA